MSNKKELFTEDGTPKRIKCYMEKSSPVGDFITVVYTHAKRAGFPKNTIPHRGMSGNPSCPQGASFFGEGRRGFFKAPGSLVSFSCLPKEC